MNILVTGAAGFIGYHLCSRLLADKNHDVFGIDNMNDYYSVALKKARVRILNSFSNFSFKKIDISNNNELKQYCDSINPLIIIHLAAQAGVRFSIKNPKNYVESNLVGHSNILDIAQKLNIEHLVYASSSSVYGESSATPYNELELSLNPESFYAALKYHVRCFLNLIPICIKYLLLD